MRLTLTEPTLKALRAQHESSGLHPELRPCLRDLYSTTVHFDSLSQDAGTQLLGTTRTTEPNVATRIEQYRLIEQHEDAPVNLLHYLHVGIKKVLTGTAHGWIFAERRGQLMPYLITSVQYVAADARTKSPAAVTMTGAAHNSVDPLNMTFDNGHIRKGKFAKNARMILIENGFLPETPDLYAAYVRQMEHHASVTATDHVLLDVDGLSHLETYGTTSHRLTGQAILDLSQRKHKTRNQPNLTFWEKSDDTYHFEEVPEHPNALVFDLSRHRHVTIHTSTAKVHEFRRCADDIVLPPLHRKLIEVLTNDSDVLKDVIEQKSLATTVLCIGAPGLGKTLTAEIYAEETGKALYRVHSGQLGLKGDTVETNLEQVFRNAERWKAVLLIDEADIYIRERRDDLNQNAIVASFLRTLEYFSGLLFMTSNREDIDDAILSRAVARIVYAPPGQDEAKRIWTLHSANMDLSLSDELITHLVATYPDATGRDILQLLRLTARYATARNIPLDMHAFEACAPFRGLGNVRETR